MSECRFCEPLGGNVTCDLLLWEWAETELAGALVAHVRRAAESGGVAYVRELDRLLALRARLTHDDTAPGDLATFAVNRPEDFRSPAESLLVGLLPLLPDELLADAVARACYLLSCECAGAGCLECGDGGRS